MLPVLASSSADAGTRPVCITLMPPPRVANGGYFEGGLPSGGTKWEAAYSVTLPEHRAECGASRSSHAPPSPIPRGWAITHRLLGQSVLERCLPERVLKQLPGPGRLLSCLCWRRALVHRAQGVHSWLSHFSPTPLLEKSMSTGPGGSLSTHLTPQPGRGLENPDLQGCRFLS